MKHPLYAGSVSILILKSNCEISPDAVEGLYSLWTVNTAGSRSSSSARYKIYDMAVTEEAIFVTVLVVAARTDESTANTYCFLVSMMHLRLDGFLLLQQESGVKEYVY